MTHKSLPDLIKHHGGAEFPDDWPYACIMQDGSKRFVLGKSPKDAAARLCEARRCTATEVKEAAFELLGVTLGGEPDSQDLEKNGAADV